MIINEAATFKTVIDVRIKDAITPFCKRSGIKLRYMVEQHLVEHLVDEFDLETYSSKRKEK